MTIDYGPLSLYRAAPPLALGEAAGASWQVCGGGVGPPAARTLAVPASRARVRFSTNRCRRESTRGCSGVNHRRAATHGVARGARAPVQQGRGCLLAHPRWPS